MRYDATRYDGPSLTAVIAISHSGKQRVICFPCVERAVVLGRLRWYRVFVSGSGPRGGGQEERGFMTLRAMAGGLLGVLGVVCAVVGIFF